MPRMQRSRVAQAQQWAMLPTRTRGTYRARPLRVVSLLQAPEIATIVIAKLEL